MLFFLFSLSHAVPLQLNHQGRLSDKDGVVVEGEHQLSFRIYDDVSVGSVQWEETLTVTFEEGYYSVTLGEDEEGNPLDDSVLSSYPLWLELVVDGDVLSPRQPIKSVPYAHISEVAESVDGGVVHASEVIVDGTTVIDELGNWVGEPEEAISESVRSKVSKSLTKLTLNGSVPKKRDVLDNKLYVLVCLEPGNLATLFDQMAEMSEKQKAALINQAERADKDLSEELDNYDER